MTSLLTLATTTLPPPSALRTEGFRVAFEDLLPQIIEGLPLWFWCLLAAVAVFNFRRLVAYFLRSTVFRMLRGSMLD